MTFTIELGWWIAPAAVTLAAFLLAGLASPKSRSQMGYGSVGDAIVGVFICGVALIVSLVAWFVWAVLT